MQNASSTGECLITSYPTQRGYEETLMKASAQLAALFATALLLACPDAFAQNSVTLYGRIDGGVQYLNHIATPSGGSTSSWTAEGGDWGTSMLGFKGSEDLGGGMSSVFDLETALQIMNGTTGGGRLFSRRAYAGLADKRF